MDNTEENIMKNLLDNELFLEWLISPTPELDTYWHNHPDSDKLQSVKKEIDQLRKSIASLKIQEVYLSDTEKADMLAEIMRKIHSENKPHKLKLSRWKAIVSTAAAIALLLIGSQIINYISKHNSLPQIDYTSMLGNVDDNEIHLIQDEKITKIAGEEAAIAYNENGEVNIGDEKTDSDLSPKNEYKLNQLIVPYGKTSQLTLSDNTKVWVNAGTKVIYPSVFDAKKREIFVEGEIFIDVTPSKGKPFIVKTAQMDIKVMGTSFNVSAYTNEEVKSVVLVTGLVTINHNKKGDDVALTPSQMYTYAQSSQLSDISSVDTQSYTSWIQGFLLLRNQSLPEVLRKIERHYNIPIKFDAGRLKDIHISGKLDLKDNLFRVVENVRILVPKANMKIEVKDDILYIN